MNRNFVCLLVLLSGLIGCDTNEKPVFPVYPVKGTVKYDDGKPLTDCWIEFTSQAGETKGRNSNSKIDKDGNLSEDAWSSLKQLFLGFGRKKATRQATFTFFWCLTR